MLPDWLLIEDVCAGQRVVKAKRTAYLPMPNPTDSSKENTDRYSHYVDRAVFYNVTGRTLDGMVGIAFAKDPTLTINASLDYLKSNADGEGNSIYQLAQESLTDLLRYGRAGVFVDYPATNGEVSKAQKQSANIRPTINVVDAKQIINWRTDTIGGINKLVLVVIKEDYAQEIGSDEFQSEIKIRYRVLSLNDGVYTVRIFDDSNNLVETRTPTDGTGSAWDFIPFSFIGTKNNDSKVDKIPLLDIANMNLAHYHNSADYEDSVFFSGQPQFYISGLTEEWARLLKEDGIYVGSRTPLVLPEGGTCGFAQASPNPESSTAMQHKEAQMAALGAQLIYTSQNKTATQQNSEDSATYSTLALCVSNISDAFTLALSWCARFENINDEQLFSISREFTQTRIDPQMLSALIQSWQAGAIPLSQLLYNLRKYETIDPEATDEEIKAEIDTEAPDVSYESRTNDAPSDAY